MADQSRLNYGMEKLTTALDGFEAAAKKLSDEQQSNTKDQLDFDSLKQQNAELEKELAEVKTRALLLEDANDEVSERLGTAAESIRDVLRAV